MIRAIKNLLRFRGNRKGYVAILLCVAIPVILLGAKWAMDQTSGDKAKMYAGSGTPEKKCAMEAALEVAKKWNPGLTLNEQKESLLRIADEVYNKSPHFIGGHAVHNAIIGLEARNANKTTGGQYDPLRLMWTTATITAPTIAQEETPNKNLNIYTTTTGGIAGLRQLYAAAATYQRGAAFVLDDFLVKDLYLGGGSTLNVKTRDDYYASSNLFSTVASGAGTPDTDAPVNYKKRKSDNTSTDNDRVKISVDGDKIKVLTNNDTGYAVPAACNVDIVLAIPTNGAACNKDNRDSSSPTAGAPSFSTSAVEQGTPIYQIAQAYKTFLRNNFEFTKGVNVGLIPYSGKFSIPPDRATGTNDWTEAIPPFIASRPTSGAATTPYFLENQTTCPAYIRGAFLYGTSGVKDAALNPASYTWGSTGILCRGNTTAESVYGNNKICVGDLLSTDDPTDDGKYKFRKMNCNPCYLGYANFLSMKCEKDCESFIPNPYFLIELNSDVGRIKCLLDMLIPIPDNKNVSNFIFLPITWANNLFQSWTNDPVCAAVGTTHVDAATTGGQLSRPSKTTTNRKKALILVVNKPDWFEPQELTYLGFDNDYSEIPMVESDCIRFDIDYTANASKKFADGTAYDGTIQGAKKILKYEETSENGSVTGKLSFPQKYLVKVVVEATESNMASWTSKGNTSLSQIDSTNGWAIAGALSYGNNKWMSIHKNGKCAISADDGGTWTQRTSRRVRDPNYCPFGLGFGNGKWITLDGWEAISHVSIDDGGSWTEQPHGLSNAVGYVGGAHYGNGKWIALHRYYGGAVSINDCVSWTTFSSPILDLGVVSYGNGKWIACNYNGGSNLFVSSNDCQSFTSKTVSGMNFQSICYGNGAFVALSPDGKIAVSRDDGETWTSPTTTNLSPTSGWLGICYGNGKFMAANQNGSIFTCVPRCEGSITFNNLNSITDGVLSTAYTVTERKEFYIEPSQIGATNTITFNMTNIRLISAEITNRPYTKKKAEAKMYSGTYTTTSVATDTVNATGTTGTGIATIIVDAKTPLMIKASTSSPGTVAFSNANNSAISNSGAQQTIIGSQTFTFPSSNFNNNFQLKKIGYSLSNGNITGAILTNQKLRSVLDGNNRGFIVNTDQKILKPTTSVATPANSLTVNFQQNVKGKAEFFLARWVNTGHGNSSSADFFCDNKKIVHMNLATEGVNSFTVHEGASLSCVAPTPGYYSASDYKGEISLTDKINHVFQLTSSTDSTKQENFLFYILIMNDEQITLGSSSDDNSIYLDDNHICFNGTGDLSITVQSTSSGTGTIAYSKPTDTTTSSGSTTITNADNLVLAISPETHKYERQPDGKYNITLTLTNIQISDPEIITTEFLYEFSKLRLPDTTTTRTVDFSVNGLAYHPSSLHISLPHLASFPSYWGYDSRYGYYTTKNSTGYFSHINFNSIHGDHFVLLEDHDSAPKMYFAEIDGWDTERGGRKALKYDFSGTHRMFKSFSRITDNEKQSKCVFFDIERGASSLNTSLIFQGITLPVNAALYYGASGGTSDTYKWHKNDSGALAYDATQAAARVTIDACTKLKADHGSDIRIYVVKYRKQDKYKHKVTGAATDFSYGYIDNCATGTTGTTNPYLQDVSSEAGLNIALQTIANDIKTWSGYAVATNVTASGSPITLAADQAAINAAATAAAAAATAAAAAEAAAEATAQAAAATQVANAAAAVATQAAEAAAQAAMEQAEMNKKEAENQKTTAETQKTAADNALTVMDAKNAATAAQNAATAAQNAATAAREAATTAGTEATKAGTTVAGDYATAANKAATAAEKARDDAKTAADAAKKAKDDAITAAETAAQTASGTATTQKETAEAARDDAIVARNTAQSTSTSAADAQTAADTAAQKATAAEDAAEAAETARLTAQLKAADVGTDQANEYKTTAENAAADARAAATAARAAANEALTAVTNKKNTTDTNAKLASGGDITTLTSEEIKNLTPDQITTFLTRAASMVDGLARVNLTDPDSLKNINEALYKVSLLIRGINDNAATAATIAANAAVAVANIVNSSGYKDAVDKQNGLLFDIIYNFHKVAMEAVYKATTFTDALTISQAAVKFVINAGNCATNTTTQGTDYLSTATYVLQTALDATQKATDMAGTAEEAKEAAEAAAEIAQAARAIADS